MGQQLRSWLWLKVSPEVSVKVLVRAAVIWRLVWGWRICLQNGSLSWLLARGLDSSLLLTGSLSPSPCEPFNSTASVSSQNGSWFPLQWGIQETEIKKEDIRPFMVWSQKSHTITSKIVYSLEMSHKSWPHAQGVRVRGESVSTCLRKEYQGMHGHILKPPTSL